MVGCDMDIWRFRNYFIFNGAVIFIFIFMNNGALVNCSRLVDWG